MKITRKQFLKAVSSIVPAAALIGADNFYEIDYEDGPCGYRWTDNAGREVWLEGIWLAILNGDIVTIAACYNGKTVPIGTAPRDMFDVAGQIAQYAIDHKNVIGPGTKLYPWGEFQKGIDYGLDVGDGRWWELYYED